jgi:carbon storage regulator
LPGAFLLTKLDRRIAFGNELLFSLAPPTMSAFDWLAADSEGHPMLILSRRVGETLRIGDDVSVRIVSTFRGRVTIAIDAPLRVRILRGELERIEDDLNANTGEATESQQPRSRAG